MHYKSSKNIGEGGFAALVIALVIILVLSLMTVGFAQLMQREQRSSLDKQLSSQAYYAAESGVNDAAKAINAGYKNAKTTCDPLPITDTSPGASYLKNSNVSAATGSSYTCLLIDPAPYSLEYNPIDTQESKPAVITALNPTNPNQYEVVDSIHVSWEDTDRNVKNFVPGSNHDFLRATNWTYIGVLRLGITPLSSGNINRDTLNNSTASMFLYPKRSNSPIPTYSYTDYNTPSNNGGILDGNCSDTRAPTSDAPLYCNVEIDNIGQVNFLLTMRSIYAKTKVTIQAYDSTGTKLRLINGQTLVDSTGKAQDVLRRVQVRIPSHNGFHHPDYSLETMSNICKQMKVYPGVNNGYNCN